jgi:hypothetical protein
VSDEQPALRRLPALSIASDVRDDGVPVARQLLGFVVRDNTPTELVERGLGGAEHANYGRHRADVYRAARTL